MNIRETPSAAAELVAASAQAAKPMDPRTKALLEGPIVPTLIRLAWPNVIILFAQAATGLIETGTEQEPTLTPLTNLLNMTGWIKENPGKG